jgi:hypothetical protein
MMDIQISGVEQISSEFIVVYRDITIDGVFYKACPNRMPKETLSIRAAEYDLELDNPFALDLLLLENYIPNVDMDEIPPLFTTDTIEEAVSIMEERVEDARNEHGAPKEPMMRSLFHAAELDESTQGLTDVKRMLFKHHDKEIGRWVKINRDMGKSRIKSRTPSLKETLKAQAMSALLDQAQQEARVRDSQKR